MHLKYSVGFLIASLVQAGIIALTEALDISTLGAKLNAMELLIHILSGQVLGYILLFTIRKVEFFNKANIWLTGLIAGGLAWLVLFSINSSLERVNAPWNEGSSTILSSMVAFISFGVIATYTIKEYGYEKVE